LKTAALQAETTVFVSTVARRRRSDASLQTLRQQSRVARMLALAHHLQRAIDNGVLADRATVARAFGLSRARVTQLLDLLLLAPDIQELVLTSEAINSVEPMRERDLRAVCRARSWVGQRECFARMMPDALRRAQLADPRPAAAG